MWLCDDSIIAWLGSEAFSGVLVSSILLGVCGFLEEKYR
jgi:hypothetical protein